MNTQVVSLILGLALLGGAAIYFVSNDRGPKASDRTTRTLANTELEAEAERLRAENTDLRKRVAELEQAAKAFTAPETPEAKEQKAPDGELTDEEIGEGLKRFGSSFQRILAGKGEKAVKELRALIKRSPKVLETVRKMWRDSSEDFGKRVVAAHVLAQSGNAEAIELLSATLRDPDLGTFDHRIAAHALAFSDAEGIEPLLFQVARNYKEAGASANAAFGLARRGIDEGIGLYMAATDQAFEEGQPEAIGYLSGLPLIGDKAKPYVRERLLTYKSETALLSLIEIVKSFKDQKALEQLRKLAYDASRPVSIQKAAKGAIEALTKKAPVK